jgi:hypothetical protein
VSGRAYYRLVAGPAFDLDYRRIDAAASKCPAGPEAELRRQVLRTMLDLANGKSDGHHALSYEPGKGDLRDCVTAYIRSDPQKPADYRMVFREIGPIAPGEPATRELLAIKPRRGENNVYAHVCARLNRNPDGRQPGLHRFDGWTKDHGGKASRQAELDAKRAIAHAWTGQQPLRSSRPLAVGRPAVGRSASEGTPRDATLAAAGFGVGHDASPAIENGYEGSPGADAERGSRPEMPAGDYVTTSTGYPRARHVRSGPTGWPRQER